MAEVTMETTIKEIFQMTELSELNKYLIYSLEKDTWLAERVEELKDKKLSAFRELNWSGEGIMHGMNFLLEEKKAGRVRQHFIYNADEAKDDLQKKQVCLIQLSPEKTDTEKPFILITSGGGYHSVCNLAEAFPTARHFVKAGYVVFVLSYRVSCKGAMRQSLNDLKKAVRWILENKDRLGICSEQYALCGYSAGANLISNYGTGNNGWKAAGLPKPVCLFPVYTYIDLLLLEKQEDAKKNLIDKLGEDYQKFLHQFHVAEHVDKEYPPCYIVCGRDDDSVGFRDSELLKELLDRAGVAAVLDTAEHAPHGFGDGTGTELEGWPERALSFLVSLVV